MRREPKNNRRLVSSYFPRLVRCRHATALNSDCVAHLRPFWLVRVFAVVFVLRHPPFPNKLYHWCSLLTPQQNTSGTIQHDTGSFFCTCRFFCLVHTFTLSLLLGNFITGFENFCCDSATESACPLLLLQSLNLVSCLNFGFTLGEDSSCPAELQKKQ